MKFVHRFVLYLCDSIFPPSKDAYMVRALTIVMVRKIYSYRSINTIHVLSTYSDPRIRALIHEAKFKGNKEAFLLLGTLLSQYTKKLEHIDYILPIPLSEKRMRTRGYNQVAEVVRHATYSPHTVVRTDILVRTRDTPRRYHPTP